MKGNKLIVRFSKGNGPRTDFAVKEMSFLLENRRFKRLYPIDELVRSFKSSNSETALKYKGHESLFYNEIYASLTETEQNLYRTYLIDCASENVAAALYDRLSSYKDAIDYVQYDQLNTLYRTTEIDDTYFSEQWGILKTDCLQAWNKTRGEGVVVAVIDSGVNYDHPDINANMWQDCHGYYGRDFALCSSDPMDEEGHGTRVAGIIAAIKDNGLDIAGVAPKAKIMAVKIWPEPWDSICAPAIRYAVKNGAKVINISWGSSGKRDKNPALFDAIEDAFNSGVVVVCAAGNFSCDVADYIPASYENVIAVASTTCKDEVATVSNRGKGITVAAPGDLIYTLERYSFTVASGTSFAAPFVAGLAALILELRPQWTPNQIKDHICKYVDPVTDPAQIGNAGRINIGRCINSL